jgi:hypothetical protein
VFDRVAFLCGPVYLRPKGIVAAVLYRREQLHDSKRKHVRDVPSMHRFFFLSLCNDIVTTTAGDEGGDAEINTESVSMDYFATAFSTESEH